MTLLDPTLTSVGRSITDAKDYTDVFGTKAERSAADIKAVYRRLLRTVHPDRYTRDADKRFASDLFVRLETLYAQALAALKAGSYGTHAVLATITTRRMTHVIRESAGSGDICDLFVAESSHAPRGPRTFVKIARSPRDADLMKAEATALKRFAADSAEERWRPYVTQLVDSFVYADGGRRRSANVLTILDGFVPLSEVRARLGGQVHPLHAVWIFRRVLMALGFAHDNGVLHGAVVPEHVSVWPEEHGVVLTDWCYSRVTEDGKYDPFVALVGDYADWYPEEVTAKRPPSPATDLAMAARLMIWLMGGDPVKETLPASVPKPMRAFLKGCLLSKQSMRPQNAWLLLSEFDELLQTLGAPYYPRRFRAFTLPTGS